MSTQITIKEAHLLEWVEGSCVSEEIARANLISVEASTTGYFLSRPGHENLPVGGWLVWATNPLTGIAESRYCQFKPDQALPASTRSDTDKPGSKYLCSWNKATEAFYLQMPDDPEYWYNLLPQEPLRPIVITEGLKKAGASMTLGYPTVCLTGVWNAQVDKTALIPSLDPLFKKKGRPIILAFDADWATNDQIVKALTITGKLFEQRGATVKVASWDLSFGKGLDDLIKSQGPAAYHDAIARAIPLREFLTSDIKKLSSPNPPLIPNLLMTEDQTAEQFIYDLWFANDLWRIYQGSPYFYSNGYWSRIPADDFLHLIARLVSKTCVSSKEGTIFPFTNDLRIRSTQSTIKNLLPKFSPDSSYSVFSNGTWNYETQQLQPHNPADNAVRHYNYPLDLTDECPPTLRAFLVSSYGAPMIPLIRAYSNLIVNPASPKGYFVHIIGRSGSGKGTLLDLWTDIIGEGYCSNITDPSILESPDKIHQFCFGKRVIIFGEIKIGGPIGSFLDLVDNATKSRRKLQSSETIEERFNLRFAMASTKPLTYESNNDGWKRRAIQVPAIGRKSGPPDAYLRDKLRAEIPQILGWILSINHNERDHYIYNHNAQAETSHLYDEAEIAANSMTAFMDACISYAPGQTLDKDAVYNAYKAYCKVEGLSPLSGKKFNPSVEQLFNQKLIDGRTVRDGKTTKWTPAHWIDISFAHPLLFSPSVFSPKDFDIDTSYLHKGNYRSLIANWHLP